MTDTRCALVLNPAADETCSVGDLVGRMANEDKPLLAWAEPDPLRVEVSGRTGRRSDFAPLVRGMPTWPAEIHLIEARLFWAKSALHAVAREGGGCSWVLFEEAENGTGELMVERSATPVYTLRDLHRFGLTSEGTIKGLRAVEYRKHGRLVAWRLVIEDK